MFLAYLNFKINSPLIPLILIENIWNKDTLTKVDSENQIWWNEIDDTHS
jgi:hypothetical protein